MKLDKLVSWNELPIGDEGRRFSGTATYSTTFKAKNGESVMLDLGKVEQAAVVRVNGKEVRALRAEPCRCEIDGALKTRFFCQEAMRSHFVVSLGESNAAEKVMKWLGQFFVAEHPAPFVLNVAGPRESKAVGIQERTRRFLAEVLGGTMQESESDATSVKCASAVR